MVQRMPLIDSTKAVAVPATERIRRSRRQALGRSVATATVWAIALLVAVWLMLAGIAGFAHA
jgi:hypothetical protein